MQIIILNAASFLQVINDCEMQIFKGQINVTSENLFHLAIIKIKLSVNQN